MKSRADKLRANFWRMNWIQALTNIKAINVVVSIFYLSRGLSLSQIFYLGVFWSIGALLLEIPSSYAADRWGRKRTIIMAIVSALVYWFILLQAQGFISVALATMFYGMSFAFFSGTGTALLYDTKKELGEEEKSLHMLASFSAWKNIMKVFGFVLATIIGRNLLDWQFQLILVIDIVALVIAWIIAAGLVEPNHTMDLEESEAGIFKDAISLFCNNPKLLYAIANRELMFLAFFIPWVFFQDFMFKRGVSIVGIGLGWAAFHALLFVVKNNLKHFIPHVPVERRINILNKVSFVIGLILATIVYLPTPGWYVYIGFMAATMCIGLSMILFDEYFNKVSFSYNRATTLSLTNFSHMIAEIPIMILGGIVVAHDPRAIYVFALILIAIVVFGLRLPVSSKKHS